MQAGNATATPPMESIPMKSLTYYHNPRCSKSRQGLALFEEQNITPEIVEYLKTTLDTKTLESLADALGEDWPAMVRSGEAEYKEAGLSAESSRAEVLAAIEQYPKLLQRPIAVCEGRVVIGRPPEAMLALLDQ